MLLLGNIKFNHNYPHWLLYGAVSICGQFSNTDVSRVPVYNVSCRVCGLHEKLLPEINLLAEAVKIQVKKFTKWWDSDGIVKESITTYYNECTMCVIVNEEGLLQFALFD